MRTLWLQADSGKNGGRYLLDAETRLTPVVAEGASIVIRLGSFSFDVPRDLGDYDSINLAIYRSQYEVDDTALVSENVLAASVTDTITLSGWNARTAYNCEWSISAASMSFSLGDEPTVEMYLVVSGVASGVNDILGAGPLTVYTDQGSERASIGFQEDWALSTAYHKNDLVNASDGKVYISKQAHTSAAATEPGVGGSWTGYWRVFFALGATGAHATQHVTGGSDVIRNATAAQNGLMTAAYASKLDGIEANATADMSASEILDAVKTVDGAGSGLDADTLDGQQATAFASASTLSSHTSATSGVHGISSFGAQLVDDADAAAARTTLGLGTAATSASTAFQAADATLTAIAALGTGADKLAYFTGVDTAAETTLTSFGRSLIDDADASAARTTLVLGDSATRNVGTGSGTVCAGDDSRLSNSRTPTAHAASHKSGGSDAILLDELGTPTDNTNLNASASRHGLLPKLSGTTTTYLRGDGTWASIGGVGNPDVAYVRSGGNDVSGTIGDPAFPYATAQAAWDDGARSFDLGIGTWTISHTSDVGDTSAEYVFVRGWRHTGSTKSNLTITWNGTDGDGSGGNGKTPSSLHLQSDQSVNITLTIEGGSATFGDGNGGDIASHYLYGCIIETLTLTAGSGFGAGTSGGNAVSSYGQFTEIRSGALAGISQTRLGVIEGGTFYTT